MGLVGCGLYNCRQLEPPTCFVFPFVEIEIPDLNPHRVLKPWGSFFTLHCSSSLSCINEYLAIESG